MVAGCASTPIPAPVVATQSLRAEANVPDELPRGWRGGTVQIDVAAPAGLVIAVLENPESYRVILPFVRSLTVVGDTPAGDTLVDVVEGLPFASGRYTAVVRRAENGRITFGIDPCRPHDVAAARGSLDVEPIDPFHARVTCRIAFDLGGGWLDLVFGERVERAAMSIPSRLRNFAEKRARETPAARPAEEFPSAPR